ncbi:ATP-binding cassette domain-containing protein [Micromonospora sp. NPDC048909]|uniref:ATP-binding cassette domain-containing protein n=1 Tax=Micromonospora sp. NPDC048909 TaxID=3155643 RepID=UPI0033E268BF
MNHHAWLAALTGELRRHGVGPDLTGHVVAEAATHLRESGEPPLRVFGPPETYARAVADSLGGPDLRPPRRQPGPVRLAAQGITKRYRGRTVLDRVDLTVRAGEIAAVVGANGAGKSTFLRICAGMLSPDAGIVRVHGTLGYCPQDGGTAEFLDPDEHFVLVGAGRGLDRSAARRSGRAGAAALDWAPPAGTQTRHLSGGTRQKLNLVLAGLGEPDVLLLDEPYQGFDRGTYLDFWHEVWRWRDAGKAIVVVTHLLNQLDRVDIVLDLTTPRERSA